MGLRAARAGVAAGALDLSGQHQSPVAQASRCPQVHDQAPREQQGSQCPPHAVGDGQPHARRDHDQPERWRPPRSAIGVDLVIGHPDRRLPHLGISRHRSTPRGFPGLPLLVGRELTHGRSITAVAPTKYRADNQPEEHPSDSRGARRRSDRMAVQQAKRKLGEPEERPHHQRQDPPGRPDQRPANIYPAHGVEPIRHRSLWRRDVSRESRSRSRCRRASPRTGRPVTAAPRARAGRPRRPPAVARRGVERHRTWTGSRR